MAPTPSSSRNRNDPSRRRTARRARRAHPRRDHRAKGGGSLSDILATFEAHGARARTGRRRAPSELRRRSLRTQCGKAKCSACGAPGRVYAGRCRACDDLHSRDLMRRRAIATVPPRFRWVIETPDQASRSRASRGHHRRGAEVGDRARGDAAESRAPRADGRWQELARRRAVRVVG
jgi:hypothetical protein